MAKERSPKDSKPSEVAHDRPPQLVPSAGKDKREIMLKPNWPGSFRRTVGTGEQAKVLNFKAGEPVEVTADELKALKGDLGVALFEIERDEKGRPRFIESVEVTEDPTATKQNMDLEPGANAANV